MTFTHSVASNNFGCAKWIVSANVYEGTHTTIATALTSASSGDTIFIRPGTYTENLTLKAGVNLASYDCDAFNNVVISGNSTLSTAGTVNISGIRLQTNSAALLTVSGSVASIVNLINCYINCSNNTGITFSSSSASAQIKMYSCEGNLGTTGIAYFSHSSAGGMGIYNCSLDNTGSSTTANTISAGNIEIINSFIKSPLTTSSTATVNGIQNSSFVTNFINTTCLTVGGSGNCTCVESHFNSGTASAISIGSSVTMGLCTVGSTNTNAITGAGTLLNAGISFIDTSSLINTTTQTAKTFGVGNVNGAAIYGFTKTLTSAQVKAIHGTPIQLLPAVTGVTYVVVSYRMSMIYGGTNIFTAGAAQTLALYYGTTVSVATGLTNASIVAAASRVDIGQGTVAASQTLAATRNVALNVYNPIATEITGNAANDNTVTVDGFYYIV